MLHPDDCHKTAFVTHLGLFEWVRVPFGLKNSPKHFQRVMNLLFQDLMPVQMEIYQDDCLLKARNNEDMFELLEEVFSRFKKAQLKLNFEKCCFFMDEVPFLGMTISSKGITPQAPELESIQKLAAPTTIKEMQSFFRDV